MNRKMAATTALLTAFAFAVIVGGFYAVQASTNSTDTTDPTTGMMMPEMGRDMGMGHGRGGGFGPGQIPVSDEYKETVIGIAEGDIDAQSLIADGCNVASVHPIISTYVDGDGTVTSKAISAVLTLQKDENNVASVWVNVTDGTVTKIVTLSRTVIDKS